MKTIVPNQSFKHGRETYEEGVEYPVSDEDAHYFAMVGWTGGQVKAQDQTLEVHDGALGHVAEVK